MPSSHFAQYIPQVDFFTGLTSDAAGENIASGIMPMHENLSKISFRGMDLNKLHYEIYIPKESR